jgi:hypothetical protein
MLKPIDIIKAMQVSRGDSRDVSVYAIVPKSGPVSFYSQQRRAFNLVAALREAGRMPHTSKVAVIGGGLAGATASAAARMLGCKVTLFEANEARFHQQHGNHTRYIHPRVVDWPREGSHSPDTDLPFLNWTAGECTSVIEEIEDQWNALHIDLKPPAAVQVVDFAEDGAFVSSSNPFIYEKFDIVIIAVGFGSESTFGLNQRSYWSDEHWHQLMSTRQKTIFVSGTGDGGLIDAMRLVLLKFDHGEVLEQVMSHMPLLNIADELLNTDNEARAIVMAASPKPGDDLARANAEASRHLYAKYEQLKVSSLVPDMQVRKNYKSVILNSSLPTPLSMNSSIINRVIVHSLIARGAISYRRGVLLKFPNDEFRREVRLNRSPAVPGQQDSDIDILADIDEIIIRHGPVGALSFCLLREAEASYQSHSHLVDQVGQEECWRSVAFDPPADFRPSQKVSLYRAVRAQPAFESWLSSVGVAHRSIWVGMAADGDGPEYYVNLDAKNRRKLRAQQSVFRRTRIRPIAGQQNRYVVRLAAVSAKRPGHRDIRVMENFYAYEQCHLFSAWQLLPEETVTKVTVVAGIPDSTHPALANLNINIVDARGTWDTAADAAADEYTTSVVGLLAGNCEETDFRGVIKAESIDVINVLRGTSASQAEIANALDIALQRGSRVILLPLGSDLSSEILLDAIRDVVDGGGCIIAPAGNQNSSNPEYPAAFKECLAVCSVDIEDKKSSNSGFGQWVDVAAPGENIWSCGMNGSYIPVRGTAYSATIASGIVSLMYAVEPSLSPDKIRRVIRSSSDSIDHQNANHVGALGSGRLNAFRAIKSLL